MCVYQYVWWYSSTSTVNKKHPEKTQSVVYVCCFRLPYKKASRKNTIIPKNHTCTKIHPEITRERGWLAAGCLGWQPGVQCTKVVKFGEIFEKVVTFWYHILKSSEFEKKVTKVVIFLPEIPKSSDFLYHHIKYRSFSSIHLILSACGTTVCSILIV